jgi:hypothetical protein
MQENTTTRSGKLLRMAIGVLLAVIVLSITIPLARNLLWKYSGSGKWELELDKNGIKVYSSKSPGSNLKQFKGVIQIHSNLNRIVAVMMDTSTDGCRKFDPGCTVGEIVEPWNPKDLYWIQYYRSAFVPPYAPRDFVLKTQFSQDPQSKAVMVRVTALPDMLPANSCCLRIRHINNTWRYTPLGDGKVEVEFLGDYDLGTPYYEFNRRTANNIYRLFSHLEKIFNAEQNPAQYAFIKEP